MPTIRDPKQNALEVLAADTIMLSSHEQHKIKQNAHAVSIINILSQENIHFFPAIIEPLQQATQELEAFFKIMIEHKWLNQDTAVVMFASYPMYQKEFPSDAEKFIGEQDPSLHKIVEIMLRGFCQIHSISFPESSYHAAIELDHTLEAELNSYITTLNLDQLTKHPELIQGFIEKINMSSDKTPFITESLQFLTGLSVFNYHDTSASEIIMDTLFEDTRLEDNIFEQAISKIWMQLMLQKLSHNEPLHHTEPNPPEILKMEDDDLSDEVAVLYANALRTNTTVKTVNFSSNEISNLGACAFAETLKINSTITHLNLADNAIGQEGLCALAEALRMNTSVQALDITGNATMWRVVCDAFLGMINQNHTLLELKGFEETSIQPMIEKILARNNTELTSEISHSVRDDGAAVQVSQQAVVLINHEESHDVNSAPTSEISHSVRDDVAAVVLAVQPPQPVLNKIARPILHGIYEYGPVLQMLKLAVDFVAFVYNIIASILNSTLLQPLPVKLPYVPYLNIFGCSFNRDTNTAEPTLRAQIA